MVEREKIQNTNMLELKKKTKEKKSFKKTYKIQIPILYRLATVYELELVYKV